MSRMKSVFAIALLIAVAGAVQTANAAGPTIKTLIIGASGSWQAMAVGSYRVGKCPTGSRAGCGHATYGGATTLNVTDTRTGGLGTVDHGGVIWMVWDNTTADPNCTTSCNVWAYVKVDSVVGNRCFFATPRCTITIPTFLGVPDQKIGPASFWPAEVDAPGTIKALFTAGTKVNVAASEIRPEDALFAQCRINSTLGGGNDGLKGLGYGLNAPGVCPAFADPLANKIGTTLVDAYPPGSTTANPLAFNITGKDPFTNSNIPAFTTVNVGAVPLVFVTNRQSATGLQAVTNVTPLQLQKVFSGTSECVASDLGGGTDAINVFIREPLSGTMNGAEYTTFRLPRDNAGNYALPLGGGTLSGSQENGLSSGGVGITPVSNLLCGTGSGGARYQAVGNGSEENFIQNSHDGTKVSVPQDGIGYFYYNYGNAKQLSHNTNYGYLQINGVDPIWSVYGSNYDPGEPTLGGGVLPNSGSDLPSTCLPTPNTFPCYETLIWKGKLSFPNVRNGSYRQWIMIRLVGSTGSAQLTAAQALVTSAQQSVVDAVPDFIPAAATTGSVSGFADPGMKLLHAHYLQSGVAGNNQTETGGDEGGCIEAKGSTADLVYRDPGCTPGP